MIVEASPWVEDNQWLLDLAKNDPFIVGVVGNLIPSSPDFTKHLKRFANNPLFRGIRIQASLAKELIEQKELDGLRLMDQLDLALDVNRHRFSRDCCSTCGSIA